MTLLRRYIFAATMRGFLSAFGLIGLILCALFITGILTTIAPQWLSFDLLWLVFCVKMPQLLTLALPAALIVGIVVVLNHLTGNQELTVAATSGLPPSAIYRELLHIALMVTVVLGMISLWLNPFLGQAFEQRLEHHPITRTQLILSPQTFITQNEWTMYVESTESNHDGLELGPIFLARRLKAPHQGWETITAQSGRLTTQDNVHALRLNQGVRTRVNELTHRQDIDQFRQADITLTLPQPTLWQRDLWSNQTTLSLWHNRHQLAAASELIFRFQIMLCPFVLVPFSFLFGTLSTARRNRSLIGVGLAMVAFCLYLAQVLLSKHLVTTHWIPQGLVITLPHLVMLCLIYPCTAIKTRLIGS